jgi:hypothetical protein
VLINFVNQLTRNIGFSVHKGKTDLSELEAARLMKLTPEKIEAFEEKLKDLLTDISHLF